MLCIPAISTIFSARGARPTLLAACVLATLASTQARAVEVTYNGDYVLIFDATAGEYADLIDDFWGSGPVPDYRPEWINIDWFIPTESHDGGPPSEPGHFAINAVLAKHTQGFAAAHQYGLDADEMEDAVENCQMLGWEMMQIEAYETPSGNQYAYIAYDREGPPWEAFIGYTEDVHAIVAGDLQGAFQLVNRCETYYPEFNLRLTSLYKKDSTGTHMPKSPLLYNDMYSLYLEMAAYGYQMTSMEVVNKFASEPRFLPVFKYDGSGVPLDDVALEVPWVTADINDDEMQGMQPILISNVHSNADLGLGWQAQPLSFALWREFGKPQRDDAPRRD